MELLNSVALITGAASGLGAAVARELAASGVKLVLLDLDQDKLNLIAKETNGLGIVCNVADEKNAEQALNKALEKFREVHILVNCAGIAPAARVVGKEGPHALDLFNKVIQVNLIGTFNMLRLVSAQMSKQGTLNAENSRGVIINTASVAAYEGQIGQVAYSASKGGVVAMTLPAARELARFGIRVMTIAPGIMSTPMMAGMPEKVQAALAESVTFPKRLGQAHEYASLVKEIIRNDYLNGSVIRLDGAIRMSDK